MRILSLLGTPSCCFQIVQAWCQHRVIHGDIKPHNFVVDTSTNSVFVIDFESAVFVGADEHSCHRKRYYTDKYASPEALSGTLTLTSDLYSFGVMLQDAIPVRS